MGVDVTVGTTAGAMVAVGDSAGVVVVRGAQLDSTPQDALRTTRIVESTRLFPVIILVLSCFTGYSSVSAEQVPESAILAWE
jgi:hypothetical protein